LKSIPESGEIPDLILQSTAITNNTSNSFCNTERSSRSSRNKREQSYMDSSNIIRSKSRKQNCLYTLTINKKYVSSDFLQYVTFYRM
jgi:hypothetical protein